jgi:hypothetical protein
MYCAPANADVSAATGRKNPKFTVFDSIHYLDKGDQSALGMGDYTIIYTSAIWPKDILKAENKRPAAAPPDDFIAGLAKKQTPAKSPVIYDIEHWPLDIRKNGKTVAHDDITTAADKSVSDSMNKLIHIIAVSRKENPSVKYGYYGCVPLRDYWSPEKNDPEMLKKWREANDYLKPLADSLDVICPSVYTFFPDRKGWLAYAKANIAEAKRLANGKPVYVFLWPKYHNSNKEDGKKFIEGDFWKLQLETVYESGVDGIIIWDSPRQVNNKEDAVWNPDREWWKETVAFLARIQK